ncbi:cation-translocating P-type ATPase [Nocardioides mesophilus]|uniref:Cation-transporting P-type ATPase n=1 Tax=Nocardioides mesophilus TaxID=433659 RepID=A0A7G9R8F1_9ACTN|nr:cation-transporting P-type ATPase [Nocardioides mesophilus]QNN51876.1 cation-transporting P-type ATPase [Nocardioides mesophilus]
MVAPRDVEPPDVEDDLAAPARPERPVPGSGLSVDEARRLLEEHGPNRIPRSRPPRMLGRVLMQLRDPMLLLLLAAGVFTTLTGDVPDTLVIGLVVVLNTVLGVVQEWRAERAIAALDRLAAPWAVVIRDGAPTRLSAEDVVPGDLLVLGAGDVVAADGELVEAHRLQLDESAITGESEPRERAVGEQVEAGTVTTRGRAVAVVTRTGATSGLGRIAALVAQAPRRSTPLQQRLTRLSGQLVVAVAALATLVLLLGLARGRPLVDMILVAVSLAVAAVPESLPAVVSIALATGAHRMAQRHAVVRALPAVETLGSVTVLASDKTGTLTEGKMVVERLWTPADGEPAERDLLRDGVLCNDAQDSIDDSGDPLEVALVNAAREVFPVAAARQEWARLEERPFDNQVRRMLTLHRNDAGRRLLVCKGAAEAVAELLADDQPAQRSLLAAEELSEAGYRVLMVADREGDELLGLDDAGLRLVGLVAISDPPRAAARGVIDELHGAGIRLVLVTGDNAGTARAVAARLGLLDATPAVVEGADLSGRLAQGPPDDVGVFARIRPEQKVEIVEHLQQCGEVVAMTGDGVNDAPALRRADIGVAMGDTGTEVARQAADVVLVDDNLETLAHAVEEGRRVYTNIRTFLRYGISGGFAEVAVMLLGPFLGMPIPLLPAQILWINMLTHGLPGVAFSAEPADPRTMKQPSRPPQESILGAGLLRQIAIAGSLIGVVSLVAGLLALQWGAHVQSSVFVTLAFGQLSVALALRAPVARRRLRERMVELAVAGAVLLQLLALYVPLLQELLGTRPLTASELAAAGALGVLPGLAVRVFRGR